MITRDMLFFTVDDDVDFDSVEKELIDALGKGSEIVGQEDEGWSTKFLLDGDELVFVIRFNYAESCTEFVGWFERQIPWMKFWKTTETVDLQESQKRGITEMLRRVGFLSGLKWIDPEQK